MLLTRLKACHLKRSMEQEHSVQSTFIAVAPSYPEVEELCGASKNGSRNKVKELVDKSDVLRADGWNDQKRVSVLRNCVKRNLFDIALQIRKKHRQLAFVDEDVVRILARKADAFVEKSSNFLRRTVNLVSAFVYPTKGHPKKDTEALKLLRIILKKEYSHTLFAAAEVGNTIFIEEFIHQYPDLIVKVNDNKHTIFHIAVIYRREGTYKLLYVIDSETRKQILSQPDQEGNKMLHLVGKIAKTKGPEDEFGFPFRMQLALLWFGEVYSMIPEEDRECLNNEGKTPLQLFTEEHENLVKKSEDWMKGTASHCMVVAALFYTVVFAAAFAVPGGYNQTNGIPIFKSKATFMVFVVASAISLFSSAASILMFLSILISGYAKPDLLQSSKKLILGLATLYLSTTTMTITFSVSFFVLYYEHLIWVPILITLFGVMPIFLFAWLICPLLAIVYRSVYGSTYLFGPKKQP